MAVKETGPTRKKKTPSIYSRACSMLFVPCRINEQSVDLSKKFLSIIAQMILQEMQHFRIYQRKH